MKAVVRCIEELRKKLDKHRRDDLKEYPTRTIFIDPMLEALAWDVRDPEDVELEYPTIDGKSVDYAPKINRKPVLFVEAKPLNDPLTDVKSITQVVGYAANAGVEWCILTNGVTYKVYRSTERAEAPDKLLFEVSLDPKETEGMTVQQVAGQFERFSRDAMAAGLLDEIGEQIFTSGKVRKALDKLFVEPPSTLIRLIRSRIGDESIKPSQVKGALKRLWSRTPEAEPARIQKAAGQAAERQAPVRRGKDYGEKHHIEGKPQEVVELFRSLDKFCRELDAANVHRKYCAKTINYSHGKNIFCCVHLRKSGLRVWLKLKYSDLESPPDYVRDVSAIGHWGAGEVEIAVDKLERLEVAEGFIKQSLEANRAK
jgi:predicted transport protein